MEYAEALPGRQGKYDAMHIGVKSIKQGWREVVNEMPDFFMRHVRFTKTRLREAHEVWIAFGMESQWVDLLADLELSSVAEWQTTRG